MKSMTGYGYGELPTPKFHLGLEIKSFNNRYLDIYVSAPPSLSPLEPRIRDYLGSRIIRGKVEVYLKVKDLEEDVTVTVDPRVVQGYIKALQDLSELTGTREEIRLSHLLRIEGLLKSDKNRNVEDYWRELGPLLDGVFADYDAARTREGDSTARDIGRLLTSIEENAGAVKKLVPTMEEYFTVTIRTRMAELLGDQTDESRILTEVAMLLVRYSINEEIVRLESHLAAFRETLREAGGIGKKLDFICQEINREINTLGSKSALGEINRRVVDVKDALENIREQIRNIE
jgi:uncharacterized protein (TIGR00255 family)